MDPAFSSLCYKLQVLMQVFFTIDVLMKSMYVTDIQNNEARRCDLVHLFTE